MVRANAAVAPLLIGVGAELLTPPVNVMRMSLHPRGLAAQIVNFGEWRAHLLDRLRRQTRITRDVRLRALLQEVSAFPNADEYERTTSAGDEVAVSLKLSTPQGTLAFLSTVTVFGTPVKVTLSELSLEAFYPADPATSALLSRP
jgi:MmyB-like transcription regulator ligand binding domain